MPYLHLPVQSGSDRILAAMNRRHTRADYLDAIARMRAAQPAMAFSSDFIVGFPGETEDDFRATLSLVDEVGFAGAFSFKYSPRPGTPAADMAEQVPEEVKTERLHRLQAAHRPAPDGVQCAAASGKASTCCSRRPAQHPGQIVGRSPYLQPVQVMAPSSIDRRDPPGDDHRNAARTACSANWHRSPHGPADDWRKQEASTVAHDKVGHRTDDHGRGCRGSKAPPPMSFSPSTTTASPRNCSANTDRTSR